MSNFAPFWKKSRTQSKLEKAARRKYRAGHERAEKAKVRRRDRGCRFPMCRCHTIGVTLKSRLEVSHDRHKSMGGNPIGDRSMAAEMVMLCNHRHQDGVISRHKGTLRTQFLSADKYDGPIAWFVELETYRNRFLDNPASVETWPDGWRGVCVAREVEPGLVTLAPWQHDLLVKLAAMEL